MFVLPTVADIMEIFKKGGYHTNSKQVQAHRALRQKIASEFQKYELSNWWEQGNEQKTKKAYEVFCRCMTKFFAPSATVAGVLSGLYNVSGPKEKAILNMFKNKFAFYTNANIHSQYPASPDALSAAAAASGRVLAARKRVK